MILAQLCILQVVTNEAGAGVVVLLLLVQKRQSRKMLQSCCMGCCEDQNSRSSSTANQCFSRHNSSFKVFNIHLNMPIRNHHTCNPSCGAIIKESLW
mmetsp:Transcript_11120/g.20810  ORF Transcript_11120/g.20810 Transcript_11120/m.20810 type:complete len:97 (+) Transcript_11120:129-419(+)